MLGDALTMAAVLSGAVVGGGLLLFVVALRGLHVRPGAPRGKRSREELVRSLTTRGAIAAVVGAVVLIVTRWPVAAAGAALLALGWRGIAGGAAEERKAMARLEALAAWTESLRDTIAGAVGLEQAIPSSLRAAAPVLQPPLRTLVDRLHTRMPMPDALRRFADDLDDPSADLVVGALILNAKLRGPGLRDMLGALSASARAELDMRRRVGANRRTTRFSVQVVVGVSVGTSLLLAIANRSYVRPYDGFLGQIVLSVVVGLYGLGFIWLRRLAKFDMPQRFLGDAAAAAGPQPGVPGEVPATVAAWQRGNGVRLRGRHVTDGGGGVQ
ncbi:MAG TPA: type II secretion system F family protein [Streptosporangiaceae bacterium]|nr:type II secretion system F family protein [Streptosporangiaceae bacterium]